jgi:hypothetical protein
MHRTLASLLALASSLAFVSCSSDSSSTNKTEATTPAENTAGNTAAGQTGAAPTAAEQPAADHAAGGHTYACPMHPEVTSTKEGEKCPKCGMNLVHNDNVANGKTYRMKFRSVPAQPTAGKAATLAFTPQEAGNEKAPVPLAVVHEKKIHLIIVRKDLSAFYHEHPDYTAEGSYKVPFTFEKGGDYVLFQDYTPAGSGHQLGRQRLTVQGPKYTPVKYSADNLDWYGEGYHATLSFDKELKARQLLGMKINITQNGKPVTNLDNYLGALGHVVVISEDTERYLHVHPNSQKDKGPNISFNTNFEVSGLYRVFLQFNHGGKIHTGSFTVNVGN